MYTNLQHRHRSFFFIYLFDRNKIPNRLIMIVGNYRSPSYRNKPYILDMNENKTRKIFDRILLNQFKQRTHDKSMISRHL